MTIFIPFSRTGIGGPVTFVAKFKAGMEARGHTVVTEPTTDYDVLFLIVQCPLRYLLDAKRRGKPIVQRLDGAYYWSVAGPKFPLLNAKATAIRHLFTDLTVYQSEYSQRCVETFHGRKRNERSAIIYNGVDLTRFSPTGPKEPLRDNPRQHLFITASAFRRPDQILPLIAAVERYRDQYTTNCKLVVIGTFTGTIADVPQRFSQLPYVQFLGKVNNDELSAYHRAADVFVMTHLNPPCPNNVIEALACGLPICGIADGAMPELVANGKTGYLLPTAGTGFWRPRPIDTSALAESMHRTFQRRRILNPNVRQRAVDRFGLDTMSDAYSAAFATLGGLR